MASPSSDPGSPGTSATKVQASLSNMSLSDRCSRRNPESEAEYESSESSADDWVRASDGNVPRNSLVAGQNLNGENFYVGRVMLRGNVLPGKVLPSAKVCFVSLDQVEFSSSIYEVLVKAPSVNYSWIRMGGCVMPRNAIPSGRSACGELIYIGRHVHKGEMTPGKIIPSHRCIYIPYLGKEVRYRDFEILIQGDYPYFERVKVSPGKAKDKEHEGVSPRERSPPGSTPATL
ncbi:hypothetical protein HPB48_000851 [Haemaphysalis longicornis]|uniref:Uncharacterized protein n=1 Tax=Haemaphysalis longicornis TaxID=44386 RepID=A0A9J6GAS8_HAELO|nr:hypothetical protein HPB48_000851 [Haemaphysalis longicornis]